MRRYTPYIALALAAVLLFAATQLYAETVSVPAKAGDIVLVECEQGSRANVSRAAFSIGRVVCANVTPTTVAPTTASPTSTPTPTSPPSLPPTPTATSTASSTPTFTPTASPTATTPDGTCGAQCGTPRNFCDVSGPWAFCDDYRRLGNTSFEVPFPIGPLTLDALDTTRPDYAPQMLGGTLPYPLAFSKHEHFMSRIESGSFGDLLLRFHQPVDIPANGERHIRFDADLKPGGNTRSYFRVMLSPDITKRDGDDRSGTAYPRSFIQAWIRNGNVEGTICRNGVCEGDSYPWGDAFGRLKWWEPVTSGDDVRVPIDLYVSQTSVRVYLNGVLKAEDTFAPLGFSSAYLYLEQVSYNPCKDGQCSVADQIVHWDNVAFDGPVLPLNGLTPEGFIDYAWNSYGATSCEIGGFPATSIGPAQGYNWVTWVRRVPDTVTLSRTNISCVAGGGYSLAPVQHLGFEAVRQ